MKWSFLSKERQAWKATERDIGSWLCADCIDSRGNIMVNWIERKWIKNVILLYHCNEIHPPPDLSFATVASRQGEHLPPEAESKPHLPEYQAMLRQDVLTWAGGGGGVKQVRPPHTPKRYFLSSSQGKKALCRLPALIAVSIFHKFWRQFIRVFDSKNLTVGRGCIF